MNFSDFLLEEMIAKNAVYYDKILNLIVIEVKNVISPMEFKIEPKVKIYIKSCEYDAHFVNFKPKVKKDYTFMIAFRKPTYIEVGDKLAVKIVFNMMNTVEFEFERELVLR